jgi:hypothetical protein
LLGHWYLDFIVLTKNFKGIKSAASPKGFSRLVGWFWQIREDEGEGRRLCRCWSIDKNYLNIFFMITIYSFGFVEYMFERQDEERGAKISKGLDFDKGISPKNYFMKRPWYPLSRSLHDNSMKITEYDQKCGTKMSVIENVEQQ